MANDQVTFFVNFDQLRLLKRDYSIFYAMYILYYQDLIIRYLISYNLEVKGSHFIQNLIIRYPYFIPNFFGSRFGFAKRAYRGSLPQMPGFFHRIHYSNATNYIICAVTTMATIVGPLGYENRQRKSYSNNLTIIKPMKKSTRANVGVPTFSYEKRIILAKRQYRIYSETFRWYGM